MDSSDKLSFIGLEVLGLKGDTGHTAKVPLNFKSQLLVSYFGLFVPRD